MRPISFAVEKRLKNSKGRAGVLKTPHGDIMTPAFVAVATKATVKGVSALDVKALGVQTIIANTYHLFLSPGEESVEKAGGVGKFMHWDGPTFTDSGGFQVFSLGSAFGKGVSKFRGREAAAENLLSVAPAIFDEDLATSHGKLAIVDDEGVTFTSHWDGSLHRFTPERSVEIQHKLGADVFFAFDECTAPTDPYEYQKEAMERTHHWAKRSITTHRQNVDANQRQGIYGIGQGGQFDELRRESARAIAEMNFDGFGLGGSFSKKYGDNSLQSALLMLDELPSDMPVHGLGVGEPDDILLGVEHGVDTFDAVTPTRNGRTGGIYATSGKYQVTGAKYQEDFSPLDPECSCIVCLNFTKSYIHHLFRTKEMLGPMLASQHNIYFFANFTRRIREAILTDSFEQFRDGFLKKFKK